MSVVRKLQSGNKIIKSSPFEDLLYERLNSGMINKNSLKDAQKSAKQ